MFKSGRGPEPPQLPTPPTKGKSKGKSKKATSKDLNEDDEDLVEDLDEDPDEDLFGGGTAAVPSC